MSEPSRLIPNLNEMMEAYTEVEEETVQETQSREMQAGERAKNREKPRLLRKNQEKGRGEPKKWKQNRGMKK